MKERKELIDLIVGILGVVAVVCGLFGIGRMSALWRLIHIAGGAVIAYSELPALAGLVRRLQNKYGSEKKKDDSTSGQ